eukprot:3012427-Prorocentrum_lima.AAC.1
MPYLRRKFFPGTNIGNKLGDVVMPGYRLLWSKQCMLKHAIHDAYRQAVRGTTNDDKTGASAG